MNKVKVRRTVAAKRLVIFKPLEMPPCKTHPTSLALEV
jgi:hypothetical protein